MMNSAVGRLKSNDKRQTLKVLLELNKMLPNNGPLYYNRPFLDALLEKSTGENNDLTILRMSVVCMGHLLFKCGSKVELDAYRMVITRINELLDYSHKNAAKSVRLATSCLKTCLIILGESKQVLDSSLMSNLLCSICKLFAVYSNENIYSLLVQSDSEHSDASGLGAGPHKSIEALQISGLKLIAQCSHSQKMFVSYFHLLYSEYAPFSPVLLIYDLCNPQVSVAAIHSLCIVLKNSSKYFQHASFLDRKSAFVSHSEKLGLSLLWLHEAMIKVYKSAKLNRHEIGKDLFPVFIELLNVSPYEKIEGSITFVEEFWQVALDEMLSVCGLELGAKILERFPRKFKSPVGRLLELLKVKNLNALVLTWLCESSLNEYDFIEYILPVIDLLSHHPDERLVNVILKFSLQFPSLDFWKAFLFRWALDEVSMKYACFMLNAKYNYGYSPNETSLIISYLLPFLSRDYIFKTCGFLCMNNCFQNQEFYDCLVAFITKDFHNINFETKRWALWTAANISDNYNSVSPKTWTIIASMCSVNELFYVSGLRIIANKSCVVDPILGEFIAICLQSKSPKILWNACRAAKATGLSRFDGHLRHLSEYHSNEKVRQAALSQSI